MKCVIWSYEIGLVYIEEIMVHKFPSKYLYKIWESTLNPNQRAVPCLSSVVTQFSIKSKYMDHLIWKVLKRKTLPLINFMGFSSQYIKIRQLYKK